MKKGKLFEMLENIHDEGKVKNFIIMNGKTKPYCPVSFADCETENTKKKLIAEGRGDILDSVRYFIMTMENYKKDMK